MATPAYSILISSLFSEVGTISVTDHLTQHFAGVIESKRDLLSIKTVAQLIKMLEVRDEINESDVSILRSIFQHLSKSSKGSGLFASGCNLIDNYKKLQQTGDKEGKCAVCAAPSQARLIPYEEEHVAPPVAEMTKLTVEDKPVSSTEKDDDSKVLRKAIMEIDNHLSTDNWIRLGRILEVEEHHLRHLKEQRFIKSISELVHEMLTLWIQENGSKATVGALAEALRTLCRVDLAEKLEKKFSL